MKYVLVSVRDRTADIYGRPVPELAVGSAIRNFADEINRGGEQNMFAKHPEDFDLYVLGTFDDSDGSFVTDTPRQVAIGKDLVVKS